MNTEIIVEQRPDGLVIISSKEFRDGLAKAVAEYPGGADAYIKMIRKGFEPFPKREPSVIPSDK